MWEKVVFNLLSNPLKFTFEGRIDVSLRSADHHVEFVVRDTGIAIGAYDSIAIYDAAGARGATVVVPPRIRCLGADPGQLLAIARSRR